MCVNERNFGWIVGVRDALAAADLAEPPGWVRERANRLFKSMPRPAVPALIDRLRASLLFDSRLAGMTRVGVRSSVAAAGPWQLLYRGGDVDVDLMVRPNTDGRTMSVRGQALSLAGRSIANGVVEALPANMPRPLHGRARPSASSELEPSGEFALSDLAHGRYDVFLRFGAREIELHDVEL
jgi:hypothetical protein